MTVVAIAASKSKAGSDPTFVWEAVTMGVACDRTSGLGVEGAVSISLASPKWGDENMVDDPTVGVPRGEEGIEEE
jgi:hypothetical protein